MFLLFILLQLLQITTAKNLLPDLNLKLFEETNHPVVFVSCQTIDEFCDEYQQFVFDATENLKEVYPEIEIGYVPFEKVPVEVESERIIGMVKNAGEILEYDLDESVESVQGWIHDQLFEPYVEVETREEHDKLYNGRLLIVFFLYMKERNEKLMNRFKMNSEAYMYDDVVFVTCIGNDYEKELNGKEYHIIVRHIVNNKPFTITYNQKSSLVEFIEKNTFPIYTDFKDEFQYRFNGKHMMLYYYLDKIEKYDEMMLDLALKYQDKIVVTKYQMKPEEIPSFEDKEIPKEFIIPRITMLHPNHRSVYAPMKTALIETPINEIEKWIESIVSEEIQPVLKSRMKEEVEYEDEIVGTEYVPLTQREDCVIIFSSYFDYYREKYMKPLKDIVKGFTMYFMNINYDELPVDLGVTDELLVSYSKGGKEPMYFLDHRDYSAHQLLETIVDYCELKVDWQSIHVEEFMLEREEYDDLKWQEHERKVREEDARIEKQIEKEKERIRLEREQAESNLKEDL